MEAWLNPFDFLLQHSIHGLTFGVIWHYVFYFAKGGPAVNLALGKTPR